MAMLAYLAAWSNEWWLYMQMEVTRRPELGTNQTHTRCRSSGGRILYIHSTFYLDNDDDDAETEVGLRVNVQPLLSGALAFEV
jgi:hypothetical protein